MPLEQFKPETLVVASIALLTAIWKALRMFFSLKARVEANEKRINEHIDTCPQRLQAIHDAIEASKREGIARDTDMVARVTRVDDKVDKLSAFLMGERK